MKKNKNITRIRVPETFKSTHLTAEQYRNLTEKPSIQLLSVKQSKLIPIKKIKPSKYLNKKTVYKGIKFDSIKERDRFLFLEQLEKKGMITKLQRQVKFDILQPSDKFKGISYRADFTYLDQFGKLVVEDVKPYSKKKQKFILKPEYIIKKKLMYSNLKILINEV